MDRSTSNWFLTSPIQVTPSWNNRREVCSNWSLDPKFTSPLVLSSNICLMRLASIWSLFNTVTRFKKQLCFGNGKLFPKGKPRQKPLLLLSSHLLLSWSRCVSDRQNDRVMTCLPDAKVVDITSSVNRLLAWCISVPTTWRNVVLGLGRKI